MKIEIMNNQDLKLSMHRILVLQVEILIILRHIKYKNCKSMKAYCKN